MTNWQRIFQSTVRAILSLSGHGGAIAIIYYSTTPGQDGNPLFVVPDWLPAMIAMVITWYFATKESGELKLPHWQVILRTSVRGFHAFAGAIALVWLLIHRHEIPKWWVAIYLSILTFYFIELRDPPEKEDSATAEIHAQQA